jgi:hypothetical protein
LELEFRSVLHYPLIDEKMGFRRVEPQKGDTCFVPYTEGMIGKLSGRLPEGLQPTESGEVPFEGEITLELDDPRVVEAIAGMRCVIIVDWGWLPWEPSEILKIQPVFIGSGPDDPTATGTAFDTLIRRAADMWNRCGTVRCIRILCDPPVYVNNDAYRVLNNDAEASTLHGEIDVDDAVEIFVVERFESDMAIDWGGGGTYASGTESAKIVTCDQQLDVPCPPPCGYGFCRDVNYFHLAHELGHVLNLDHPDGSYGLAPATAGSVMEGSGFCLDNPDRQSAQNCRNASNPLLYWGGSVCTGSPDISD